MAEHYSYGGSKFGTFVRCLAAHGRIAAIEARDGPEEAGPAAQWGTDSHALLETALNLSLPPMALLPADADQDTREQHEAAQPAWEYAQKVLELNSPAVLMVEELADPGAYFGRDDVRGTADITICTPMFLEVVDFKTGYGIVEPHGDQNRFYLAGMLHKYWPDMSTPCPFQFFRSTIVQPRAPHPDGIVRSVDFTPQEMVEYVQVIRNTVIDSEQPNPPATPGETQCKYCRARSECPEYAQWSIGSTLGAAGVTELSNQAINAAIEVDALGSMAAEQLARIYELLPSLDNFAAAVTAEVRNRLGRAEDVPGYKLTRAAGRPAWKDEEEKTVIKRLRALKLKKGQYTSEKLATPLQVMKAGLDEQQSAAVAELWSRPEGPLKIVPASAPGDDAMAWMKSIK